MDTRIQFRVDDETKDLAQKMAESQGLTLSDACREFTEQMAEQQRKELSHEAWFTEKVNMAFEKYDSHNAVFIDNASAKSQMEARKARIRSRGQQ